MFKTFLAKFTKPKPNEDFEVISPEEVAQAVSDSKRVFPARPKVVYRSVDSPLNNILLCFSNSKPVSKSLA